MSVALRMMRKLAQNNRLANLRLLTACEGLSAEDFAARRTSFFPSLKATLNHIVTVDWFYVDALEGGTLGLAAFADEEPFDAVAPLMAAQAEVDARLLALVARLDDAGLSAPVDIQRSGRIQTERTDDVLMHLFMHQTHHRGQAHAMLAGTEVSPPQLDEFIVGDDARFRTAELTALG
ncbi:DinB family protein [Devosia sp.]|uniref:DinB family protein n=1 Tax=Devosia sp. TaxID=1871048 RepID=UPI003A8D639A